MTSQSINVFFCFLLKTQKVVINTPSALHANGPITHTMAGRQAVRKRCVHTDHYRTYFRIGGSALEHTFQPTHLVRRELVMGGIVEIDKINSTLYPMEIGFGSAVLLAVGLPLFVQCRR